MLLISRFFVKIQIHIYTNENTTCIYEKAFESFWVNTMYVSYSIKAIYFLFFFFFRINKIQRSKLISAVEIHYWPLLTSVEFTKTRKAISHKGYHKKPLLPTIQRTNLQCDVCKQFFQTSMQPFSNFRGAE